MKRFAFYSLGLIGFLSGCSFLGDSRPPAPTVKVSTELKACQFKDWDSFRDQKKVSVALIHSAADCVQEQIDSAFSKIRGKVPGELSLAELQTLEREKILDTKKAFGVEFNEPAQWLVVEEVLRILHPEARAALSQKTLHKILDYARAHSSLAIELLNSEHGRSLPHFDQMLSAAEGALVFLSDNYRISLGRAKNLLKLFVWREDPQELSQAEARLEAIWILKSLGLPTDSPQDVRGDVTVSSIKSVVRWGLNFARQAPLTRQWIFDDLHPAKIPSQLPDEWEQLSYEFVNFFSENSFAPVERDFLAWSIRKVSPYSYMWDFSADFIRTSQRLSPKGKIERGLHPRFLTTVVQGLRPLAEEMIGAAAAYSDCTAARVWDCQIPYRVALTNPVLKNVALKSPFSYWSLRDEKSAIKKSLDLPLYWYGVTPLLIKRSFVGRIFDSFDRSGNGIALAGGDPSEIKEALDLANSFIRFASIDNGASKSRLPENKEEEPVIIPIVARAAPLHRILGLVGERWFQDGEPDGLLTRDEFFSAIQMFTEVQQNASTAVPYNALRYFEFSYPAKGATYEPAFYRRDEFVKNLGNGFKNILSPLLYRNLEELGAARRNSFFHALVNDEKKAPLRVVKTTWGTRDFETLIYYVEGGEALAPSAILTALDKLWIRCDSDENGVLDWKEMDCAVAPMLAAGLEVINSGIVEIRPGVNDLSRVLLDVLQKPGVPVTIAKVLIANGSLTELNISEELFQWVENEASLNVLQVVPLVTLLSSGKGATLSRYLGADSNHDGKYCGRKEMQKLANIFSSDIKEMAEREIPNISWATLQKFKDTIDNPLFQRVLIVGLFRPEVLTQIIERLPLKTTPVKVLALLEQLLRRDTTVDDLK